MTGTAEAPGGGRRPRDLMWLVAIAAALWGTSALLREPLARELATGTIVFYEHLVLVVCTLPWLLPALRAFRLAGIRTRLAVAGVGVGASALATTLFTAAFQVGDPITPQVLQKLQPVFAILLAVLLLGERLSPRFGWFLLPALAGSWVLAFPDPFDVVARDLQGAALAIGAAVLWASGTVLGRLAGADLSPMNVTVLRFVIALPTVAVIAVATDAPLTMAPDQLPMVIALALLPGLLALRLYYAGLRRTPAVRATLAELAFPASSAVVGVVFLGAALQPSQWLGFAVVLAAVTALALNESISKRTAVVTRETRPTEKSGRD